MTGLFSERGDRVTGFDVDKDIVAGVNKQNADDDRVDASTIELHDTVEAFVASFVPGEPRVIVFSLPHGKTGDNVLDQLLPLLDPDDLILDGANEHWRTTEARQGRCARQGVHFLGLGVSGGYQAAR
jgi:6-phosphogluconate dehydrogenase